MDKELLRRVIAENPRVIIPSFGAFLHKQQGGAIVFSPFLKTDDGLLKDLVSKEYGVEHSDAESMIGEFVEHMRGVLAEKSKYYIDDLGMLIVDSNGAISFVAEVEKTEPAPAPIPAPIPTIQPSIAMRTPPTPQPITAQPVAQPITPQRVTQPMAAQPMTARAPIPQPIARPTMTAPPTGIFARPGVQPPIGTPMAEKQQHVAPPIIGAPNIRQSDKPQQRRRPPVPLKKKGNKNDLWLIIAILAALVVIVLMVIGIMTASEVPQLTVE